MSENIRIVLADDHPLMNAGLKMTVGAWEEFEIVGVASNGREAVELCRERRPDLALLDMQMPELSGAEAIRLIRQEFPEIRVVAFTTFDDSETVSQAMDAGCNGFLLKVMEPEKLKASLLSVASGMNVFDEGALEHLRKSLTGRPAFDFSERELEVLRHVCRGLTNAEIADRLKLRPGTVKNMISLLLSKTGCISRAQLVRYASENRLVE